MNFVSGHARDTKRLDWGERSQLPQSFDGVPVMTSRGCQCTRTPRVDALILVCLRRSEAKRQGPAECNGRRDPGLKVIDLDLSRWMHHPALHHSKAAATTSPASQFSHWSRPGGGKATLCRQVLEFRLGHFRPTHPLYHCTGGRREAVQ